MTKELGKLLYEQKRANRLHFLNMYPISETALKGVG
jgi:hypothetical protein